METAFAARAGARAPFDAERADRLMEEAGLDALLATSRHNVSYLLGGHRFFFFQAMEAFGHSRYLPIVAYVRGRPEAAAYVANPMERWDAENRPFWTPELLAGAWGSVDAAALAVAHLKRVGPSGARVGIEPGFLPADAWQVLAEGLGQGALVDATGALERLRALKTPAELETLRAASERITDAMLATIAWAGEGASKAAIIERLRQEEVARGLWFDYCLLTLGASHNRASSEQRWREGEVLSIDSGGNLDGYIGDLCRMAVLGEPDAELVDLLDEVEAAQQAAFAAVRAGTLGAEVIERAEAARRAGPNAAVTDFVAHGMGLVSHEVPFLVSGAMYEGVDAERPLEAGMVLSVETTMKHPRRGFVKLEDTVVVTAEGHELLGARGRGWNRGGTG